MVLDLQSLLSAAQTPMTPETFQRVSIRQHQVQISSRPACRPLPRARLRPTLSLAIHAQRIGRFCRDVLFIHVCLACHMCVLVLLRETGLAQTRQPISEFEGKATHLLRTMCGSE